MCTIIQIPRYLWYLWKPLGRYPPTPTCGYLPVRGPVQSHWHCKSGSWTQREDIYIYMMRHYNKQNHLFTFTRQPSEKGPWMKDALFQVLLVFLLLCTAYRSIFTSLHISATLTGRPWCSSASQRGSSWQWWRTHCGRWQEAASTRSRQETPAHCSNMQLQTVRPHWEQVYTAVKLTVFLYCTYLTFYCMHTQDMCPHYSCTW